MSDKLFKAAREAKPDTSRAEYGFETRLLARLRAERSQPISWRLLPVFAAIVLMLGVWNRAVFTPVSLETALGGTAPVSFLEE
ncbi:MAG: hypothetical protein WCS70_14205 [Verrucomicrobiota bacterium]